MNQSTRQNLTKLGHRVTDTQTFLALPADELAPIDLKLSLIEKLKSARAAKHVTQHQLARLIGSSQSRIAMLDPGRPDISLDLTCRALFALGLTRRDLAKAITPTKGP